MSAGSSRCIILPILPIYPAFLCRPRHSYAGPGIPMQAPAFLCRPPPLKRFAIRFFVFGERILPFFDYSFLFVFSIRSAKYYHETKKGPHLQALHPLLSVFICVYLWFVYFLSFSIRSYPRSSVVPCFIFYLFPSALIRVHSCCFSLFYSIRSYLCLSVFICGLFFLSFSIRSNPRSSVLLFSFLSYPCLSALIRVHLC